MNSGKVNSGKIIQINPDLFQISKKTKKNRPEKEKISIPKPIIGASSIKRKLLNRIKQKKIEENKSNKKNIQPKMVSEENDDLEETTYDGEEYDDENNNKDELSVAMDYFNDVEKREKERKKIINKTYKNRINENVSTSPVLNNISLNIPYQLKPAMEQKPNLNDIANNILDDLPYGCLKGGTKPTYKTWMNSVKNYSSMSNTDKLDSIRPPTPPKKKPEEKIFTESEYKESLFSEPDKHKENILKKQIDDKLKKIESEQKELDKMDDEIEPMKEDNVSNKKYVKKIIKKKYTLGKSNKYKKVGVLIKGRQTKKNIINSHKKLKRTDIHQIKKYLKKHGMLKSGSSCPDEILRKMYESAMLSGEVNNTNKNTLIHNFLNDEEIK